MSDGLYVELDGNRVINEFANPQPGNPNVTFWADGSPELRAYRLLKRKETRREQLGVIAAAKVQAGLSFTHNGVPRTTTLTTDRLQVVMGIYTLVISTVLTQAGIMAQQGLPDITYPPGDVPFETKDGTIVTLTRTQAVTLAQQALGRMVLLTARRNALAREISDAPDMATLNSIDLQSGWPV